MIEFNIPEHQQTFECLVGYFAVYGICSFVKDIICSIYIRKIENLSDSCSIEGNNNDQELSDQEDQELSESLIIINDSSDSEQHGDPSYTPVISVLRKRRKRNE